MLQVMRLLQLLAMVIWVGGLIFFAFVLAPTAFHTLPTQHEAGLIVGACLRIFDVIALTSGVIFLITTALLFRQARMRIRGRYEMEFLLAMCMMLATAYVHFNVEPAMELDRARAGGDINLAAANDPSRIHFETLHKRSETTEGAVLLIGLGVLVLMSREHAQVD